MNLFIKISNASKGSTEPRRLFAALAQAFGRQRNNRAMMSLSTKISIGSGGATGKLLGKFSGAELSSLRFSPPLPAGEVSRHLSATEGAKSLGGYAPSGLTTQATSLAGRGGGVSDDQ